MYKKIKNNNNILVSRFWKNMLKRLVIRVEMFCKGWLRDKVFSSKNGSLILRNKFFWDINLNDFLFRWKQIKVSNTFINYISITSSPSVTSYLKVDKCLCKSVKFYALDYKLLSEIGTITCTKYYYKHVEVIFIHFFNFNY